LSPFLKSGITDAVFHCVGNSISQLKKENNDLISDDYDKACLLNNYFCSISTLNDSNTSKPDFPLRTNATLDFFQITPSKVLDIMILVYS
jgi:hypothetical protein